MPGSELNLLRDLLLTTDFSQMEPAPREGLAPSEVTCFFLSVAALVSGQEKARGREEVVSTSWFSHCPVSKEEGQQGPSAQVGFANRQEVFLEQNPSKQNSFVG